MKNTTMIKATAGDLTVGMSIRSTAGLVYTVASCKRVGGNVKLQLSGKLAWSLTTSAQSIFEVVSA